MTQHSELMITETTVPTTVDTHAEKRQLIKSLGLSGQERIIDRETQRRRIDTKPMTVEEFRVWSAWLPAVYGEFTHHRTLPARRFAGFIESYSYDSIPLPVLKLWKHCRDNNLFETYEIWTPARLHVNDPALIGRLGSARYLLARWGESDANWLSYEDIRAIVNAPMRRLRASLNRPAFPMIIGLLFTVGFPAIYCIAVWAAPHF